MRKNKKLIIIISIILTLAIVSSVFAYLYLMTDMFKSDKQLFTKYFTQNMDFVQKTTNLKSIEAYKNLKNENKYESNTNIKINYSEGGEISNPLNNLNAKLNVQNNKEEQYIYADAQILYEDEEYLETEFIKEQNTYGIRFTDAIQQFITMENDENIDNIMMDENLTADQSQNIIDIINGEMNYEETINSLKNRYFNIITSKMANGEFKKQKNVDIMYNNTNIKANSYTLTLNSEQVEELLIEILNTLKNDNELLEIVNNKEQFVENIDEIIQRVKEEIEIPEVRITVYEYKKKAIKTIFEIGEYNISVETLEQDQGTTAKINCLDTNNENTIQLEIEMNKSNNEAEEKFEIITNVIQGDKKYIITFSNIIQLLQNQIVVNTEIGYNEDITTVSLSIENNINLNNNFEKKQTLNEENSKSISSLEGDKRKKIIENITSIVIEKTNERINLLKEKMSKNQSANTNVENGESQVEINKFNSKFEFYTGDNVSAENVKMLLDVVKNNINGYEFISTENSNEIEAENDKINLKITIQKDKTNEEAINEILEKISSNKKYKVSINYKEANGLIEYINITEI